MIAYKINSHKSRAFMYENREIKEIEKLIYPPKQVARTQPTRRIKRHIYVCVVCVYITISCY